MMKDWQPTDEEMADFLISQLITPDMMMDYLTSGWRKEQESKPININTKLSTALNKCPAPWVNGICINLGLDPKSLRKRKAKVQAIVDHLIDPQKLRAVLESLSPESCEALDYVLGKGGWVKIGPLTHRFGPQDDVGWFWSEAEPPTSTLGRLRVRGLLFVGKAGIGGRNYTVAVIPKELRKPLAELLAELPKEPVKKTPPKKKPSPETALGEVLQDVARYYEETIDWEPTLRRDHVEAFLNHLAAQGMAKKLLQVWNDLLLFHFFLDHYGDEIQSLDDLQGYHLSEWVNNFIERKVLERFTLNDKRRMVRTVGRLCRYLVDSGQLAAETGQRVEDAVTRLTETKRRMGVIYRPPPLGGEIIMQSYHPERGEFTFTYNDYWLALVCYADFEGDWRRLRAEARRVRDGKSKQELIDRILSIDPRVLEVLLHEVYEDEVEKARQWFYEEKLVRDSAW